MAFSAKKLPTCHERYKEILKKFNAVMRKAQVTLQTNGAFPIFVTIFGFQVSGVGCRYIPAETRHPTPETNILYDRQGPK